MENFGPEGFFGVLTKEGSFGNNARTIGHVTRAACTGLAKCFPQLRRVILNSDGGSMDGTAEAVLPTSLREC